MPEPKAKTSRQGRRYPTPEERDERVAAPEGEDFETVVRAILGVPQPNDQATSDDPEDSTGR
jgi:hypothetical protein